MQLVAAKPQLAPLPAEYVVPAGSVSGTVIARHLGTVPVLLTTDVQVPFWPSMNAAVWRLSSARSTVPWTGTASTSRSLAALMSPATATTAALTTPRYPGAVTATSSAKTRLSPAASALG